MAMPVISLKQQAALTIVAVTIVCACNRHSQMGFSQRAGGPSPLPSFMARSGTLAGASAGPCESSTTVVHSTDTATVRKPIFGQRYTPDYAYGDVIWFGTAGDSLEVTSTQGSVYTNLGQQTDSLHNVVQYFRARLQDDGVVAISTNMDVNDGDNVPYTLRIERVGPKPGAALRQTCEQAKLTVTSSRLADHFSIVPVSIAHSIHDLSKWTTFTGIYNVALVSDSLYQLCQVPCVTPDTIKLLPGASVTRKY